MTPELASLFVALFVNMGAAALLYSEALLMLGEWGGLWGTKP